MGFNNDGSKINAVIIRNEKIKNNFSLMRKPSENSNFISEINDNTNKKENNNLASIIFFVVNQKLY